MRWIAVVLLAAIGCGSVTTDVPVSADGCITNASDFTGDAASDEFGCGFTAGPPTIIHVVNGVYSGSLGTITDTTIDYDNQRNVCRVCFWMLCATGVSGVTFCADMAPR